jgi:site-specific DNA recombinase
MMKIDQTQEITKAAIYVRVSTDEQAQYGYSIEAQKEKLLAFCKSQEWKVHGAYVDNGFRATNLNRPKVQQLIEEADSKKFDIVVFYKLDRLSRSVKDLNFLIEHFEKNNIAIKSITEPFDTTSPPGKLMFNMLGSFAQFERELIGERTKLGLNRAFDEGKWATSPPYGYNVKNGQLMLNEKEALFVKRVIELFITENLGIKLIARRLKTEDTITKRSGKWSKTSVWNMLHNPVYCGMALWKGQIRERNHRAIISKEDFDNIQKRLYEKYHIPPNTNASPNFLLGLVECGRCGCKLITAFGKKVYRYYACVGRDNGCNLKYIPADKLEDTVLETIRDTIAKKHIINQCIKEFKKISTEGLKETKKELLFLKRQLQELSEKKEKKFNWIAQTLPDKAVANRMGLEIGQIDRQIEKIKAMINTAEDKINQKETGEVKAETIACFLENFLDSFRKWSVSRRKLMVRLAIDKIIVYGKDRIKLILSIPINRNGRPDIPALPRQDLPAPPSVAQGAGVPVFAQSGVADGV